VWVSFGFSANPYETGPVPLSDDGEFLLVGRDTEVADLSARLAASSTIPVLVGANGVGKTSIVRVAAHRLSRASRNDGPRYLALDPPLQLDGGQGLDRFEQDAYYRLAKVLLDDEEFLVRRSVPKQQIKKLRRWLRDPAASQRAFGVTTPFVGGSLQTSTAPSNSGGFKDAGMQMMVGEWLDLCFPDSQSGGVVCLIDNLEILRTSKQAREAVEALRDGLFARNGLRWVLCGTPAVIGGGALFSARMEGRIAPPNRIHPVAAELAPELVTRRLVRFGSPHAYAPVNGTDFRRIYAIVNSRLRSALDLCQEYSLFLHGQGSRPDDSQRSVALERWLAAKANDFTPGPSDVPSASWRLFDRLSELEGEIRSGEAALLGPRFNSIEKLSAAATSLCQTGLLERVEVDEGDYLLQVTTPGWLVAWQRRNFQV
jgi:hypothetical protein